MTEQPQVINLDWVSYSVTLALSYTERATGHAVLTAPQGYTLIECSHGTPQYKRRALLMDEQGNKVATLLLEPHSSIINPQDMFVEVANSMLYREKGAQTVRDLVQQCHEASFRSLSRIDVACDFQPDEHQRAVIAALEHTDMYVQGKRSGCQFHSYTMPTDGGKVQKAPIQLAWGSKVSSVKWKLYNKTLEITEMDDRGRTWCSKPYIPARWAAAGMGSDGVWRLECSLTGASSYDWRGSKVGWPLIEEETWEAWYYDMLATRFVIRQNQGHACRKNDREVELIENRGDDHQRLREREGGDTKEAPDHATTLRALIKELDRPEVAYTPAIRDTLLTATYNLLNHAHLHGYFLRVTGQPFEEWAAHVGDELMPAG